MPPMTLSTHKYTLTLHSEGIGTHICLSQWIRIALIELIQ